MQSQTSVTEDSVNSSQPRLFEAGLFQRKLSPEKLQLERKSYAQQLARSATRTISDRRHRAEIKAAVYNHLIPILDQNFHAQQHLRSRYRKRLAAVGAAFLLATLCAIVLFRQ
jgi:hypothetical protein